MAKKKNKKPAQQPSLSPEKYILTRARQLPVDKCYITPDWEETGIAMIIVALRHTNGNYTFGNYLVDTFCLGVKDAFYRVNIPEDYLEEFLSHYDFEECDYTLAHNLIYAAIEFAEDAGIAPCKAFDITEHILREDSDEIPLIPIEMGDNGRHHLIAHSQLEASRYIPILDATLGKNNYEITITYYDDEYDNDDYEDDEDNEDNEDDEDKKVNFPFNMGKKGAYYYDEDERPDYPESLDKLNYPDVYATLSDNEYPEYEWCESILSRDRDKLRADLESIILYHIGKYWRNFEPGNNEDIPYNNSMPNAMRLLAEVGNEQSIDVFFELMRQRDDFLYFYFGDAWDDFFGPFIKKVGQSHKERFFDFLKEKGIEPNAKFTLIDLVYQAFADETDALIPLISDLMEYYLDNVEDPLTWDGTTAAIMCGNIAHLAPQALEALRPQIVALFETDCVDEEYSGDLSKTLGHIAKHRPPTYPILTDLSAWLPETSRRWSCP